MTQRSEFAELLYNSLTNAGFRYHGKIEITDKDFDTYKDLSPKKMAELYAAKNNLIEKNNILLVLKQIRSNNLKNIFSFKGKETFEKYKLAWEMYLFIFRYHIPNLLLMNGKRAQTSYTWVPEREPVFSDAEQIYELYLTIKNFKLSQTQLEIIHEHKDLDWPEIMPFLKLKDPAIIQPAQYRVYVTLRKIKAKASQQKYIDKKITYSKEISRTTPIPEQLIEIAAAEEKEPLLADEKEDKQQEKESDNTSGIVFLLNERMNMYEKIIKNQKKHIEKLELYIHEQGNLKK